MPQLATSPDQRLQRHLLLLDVAVTCEYILRSLPSLENKALRGRRLVVSQSLIDQSHYFILLKESLQSKECLLSEIIVDTYPSIHLHRSDFGVLSSYSLSSSLFQA
jgi:hypothetical protein